ncbi:hypothetical protein AVEN_3062-1 [Araneus ventricosus]|uniref:Uncharacterized protein n=1 Tax=Araneus ventricosus TaxID=182803 RepID=A0A4Y2UEX3_ARAVE|nr:hypothetical protein AVEN_3062-1 [Araneus ventricosus]
MQVRPRARSCQGECTREEEVAKESVERSQVKLHGRVLREGERCQGEGREGEVAKERSEKLSREAQRRRSCQGGREGEGNSKAPYSGVSEKCRNHGKIILST